MVLGPATVAESSASGRGKAVTTCIDSDLALLYFSPISSENVLLRSSIILSFVHATD